MEIHITGHAKNVTKTIIRKAAKHYAGMLMNPRLHENIHCTIYLIDFEKKDDHGDCIAYYDGMDARLFDIRINKNLSKRRILEILAHEATHLKQYATGQWYEYDRTPNRHRFDNKIIDLDKESDDYWLAPWEVEAYGSEFGLYQSFMKAHKDLL